MSRIPAQRLPPAWVALVVAWGPAVWSVSAAAESIGDPRRAEPPGAWAASNGGGDPAVPPPTPVRLLSLDSKELTGDWGGARPWLADHGVKFSAFLNDQIQSVVGGGLDTEGQPRNSASIDAFLTIDLEKAKLVSQADVLLHLQSNWGAGVNDRTGSGLQVNDDADGDLGLHVAQLWYRQHFLSRRASLTLGFLDWQTMVDRNAYANSEDKQFMHQALDNNPLVPLNIGLGASLMARPTDWWTIIFGGGDAQSVLYKPGFSTAFHDEAWFFGYLENGIAVELPSSRGTLPGNYRAGVVFDPRPRPVSVSDPRQATLRGDDYGAYVSVDQMPFRESAESSEGLGVFGRYGYRKAESNKFAGFWSGGVSYTGLIPGREADELGFGVAWQRASDAYRDRLNDDVTDESVYELYYAIQVTKSVTVTPDLQYLDNPGADGKVSHAVVAGVRVRVSF